MRQGLAIALLAILFFILSLLQGTEGRIPFTIGQYYSRAVFDLPFIVLFFAIFWFVTKFAWSKTDQIGGHSRFPLWFVPEAKKATDNVFKGIANVLLYFLVLASGYALFLVGMVVGPLVILALPLSRTTQSRWAKCFFGATELGFWCWMFSTCFVNILIGLELGFFASALSAIFVAIGVLLCIAVASGMNRLITRPA